MNACSESIANCRSRTYVRALADGLRLEAEVGLCVFMYAFYPLQVSATLRRDNGESLGKAYAVDRTKTAQNSTIADVERLLLGIRIAPCRRCADPAFDPETISTNRAGLCEACFMSDLEAELARAEEAERRALAARDRRMKKKGMWVRVSAWVHSEAGGDDYQVHWYLKARPTPEQVMRFLRAQHASELDDYEIITL